MVCRCVCVCFLFGVRALGAWFYCRRRFQVLFHNYLFVCGFQSCGGGDKQHLSLSLLSCHGLSSQRETYTETQRESKGLKKSSERKSCSSGITSCCCSTSCRFYIYVGVEEEEQEHSWCQRQKGDDFLGRRRRRFGVEGNKDHRDERQPELKEEKEYHCLEKSFLFSSFLFSSPCFHEVR